MIKYRVWDLTLQKFIHPVIDITNDFHAQYPADRYIFDRMIFSDIRGDIFQNDIISIPFRNSKNWRREKQFLAVATFTSVERGDWFLNRFKRIEWIDNTHRTYPQIDKYLEKIGNVHQDLDVLIDWYSKQKKG